MKQFKRVIAIVIVAIMLMCFASCSITGGEIDITNDNIKIGVIISDAKDVTTGNTGYAMSAVNEILSLGYGIGEERFTTVESVNPDDAAAVDEALTTLINKECNLIIAAENGYLDDIKKISGDNEKIKFFVCDADNDGNNIYGYKAEMKETMYFVGMVAGMKAQELEAQKVGFIAASEKKNTLANAFAMGVAATNGNATVEVIYSADAATAANKLIKDGCVVIASDYEDEAIAKAATDAKIFFCGFGSETYLNATDEETGEKLYASATLCAPLYNYTQFYVDAIKAVVDNEEPDPFVGGYATGETFLSDLNEETVAEGTQEAYDLAVKAFEKGELKLDAVSATNVTVVK